MSLLERMRATLAEQPWIGGDVFTLGDACALPYALRLEHLAPATWSSRGPPSPLGSRG